VTDAVECTTDYRTVRTATEAFNAQNGRYAMSNEELVRMGFLADSDHKYRVTGATSVNGPTIMLTMSGIDAGCPSYP